MSATARIAVLLCLVGLGSTAAADEIDEAARLVRHGDHAVALKLLQPRLRADPVDARRAYWSGEALAGLGYTSGALDHLLETIGAGDGPHLEDAVGHAVLLARELGDYGEVRAATRRLPYEAFPREVRAEGALFVAERLKMSDRRADAVALLRITSRRGEPRQLVLEQKVLLAKLLEVEGDAEGALRAWRGVIDYGERGGLQLEPQATDLVLKARLEVARHLGPEGVEVLLQTPSTVPGWSEAVWSAVRIVAPRGEWSAIEPATRARRLEHADVHGALADALLPLATCDVEGAKQKLALAIDWYARERDEVAGAAGRYGPPEALWDAWRKGAVELPEASQAAVLRHTPILDRAAALDAELARLGEDSSPWARQLFDDLQVRVAEVRTRGAALLYDAVRDRLEALDKALDEARWQQKQPPGC